MLLDLSFSWPFCKPHTEASNSISWISPTLSWHHLKPAYLRQDPYFIFTMNMDYLIKSVLPLRSWYLMSYRYGIFIQHFQENVIFYSCCPQLKSNKKIWISSPHLYEDELSQRTFDSHISQKPYCGGVRFINQMWCKISLKPFKNIGQIGHLSPIKLLTIIINGFVLYVVLKAGIFAGFVLRLSPIQDPRSTDTSLKSV